MSIDIGSIKTNFGLSNPVSMSQLYQGQSIPPGVYPNTVPISGTISLNQFTNVPTYTQWGRNQRSSGDQPDDGCAWSVEFSNGSYGLSGWGLYVVVAIYGDGSGVSGGDPNGDGSYQSWAVIQVKTANTNTYGTLYNNNDNQFGYFGTPYANWDGNTTLRIYGNNGSGSPGDTGYAYATAQVRNNWNAMSGGTNIMVVTI